MTIGDYINSKLSIWGLELPNDFMEVELSKLSTSLNSDFNEPKADEFFYNTIPVLLFSPSSISEGGFSISYNKEGVKEYYTFLAGKLGKEDLVKKSTQPKIRDISNKW